MTKNNKNNNVTEHNKNKIKNKTNNIKAKEKPIEIGGTKGPEPTRYGDWSHKGRVSDF